jgi:DNA-binding CsgD family transcriptional regulator
MRDPRGTRDDVSPTGLRQLTPRETDVLRRAAEGRTNLQVARELGITVHAVKFHLASVFRKLGVRNRTEAAVAFLTDGHERAT